MALLTRFLKLSDHDDTQIFTFVGTKSVTRDLNRDITSKEFRYEILKVWKRYGYSGENFRSKFTWGMRVDYFLAFGRIFKVMSDSGGGGYSKIYGIP